MLYSIRYCWIILPVQTIWKYTSNWVVAGSSVSPEAPLMVQSTIIFLFRICLGVLINLLRIHNSIYQNNGILPFSLLVKTMRRELCWDSDIFDQCEKDDFIFLTRATEKTSVEVWNLTTPPYSAASTQSVFLVKSLERGIRGAFQVMAFSRDGPCFKH